MSSTSPQPSDPLGNGPDPITSCLARLAAGDGSARAELLGICMTRLEVIASRMLADFPVVRRWHDTGDVLQEVLLRLHRALETMRPATPRDLLAIATTHMHRELIDLARQLAGPRSHASHHDTNSLRTAGDLQHTDLAAGGTDDLERWEAFHAAVEGLPDEEREVFRLVWYFGCDQEQVADMLGCSVRTVKRHWQAARHAVAASVGTSPSV